MSPIEDLCRAVEAAPRCELDRLSQLLWAAFGRGEISEEAAQGLAEAIQRRRAIPAPRVAKKSVGSRPRSPQSIERRRRWVASGWMPPQVSMRFTTGEASVLAVVAEQVSKRGRCDLPLGALAALAGVGKTTVRSALQQAENLGLVTVRHNRVAGCRSDPNTIHIVSPEWATWLAKRAKGVGPVSRTPRDRFIPKRGNSQVTHVQPVARPNTHHDGSPGPYPR